jgi:hypothetical protein
MNVKISDFYVIKIFCGIEPQKIVRRFISHKTKSLASEANTLESGSFHDADFCKA